jgi:FixJ family two-component response regulator
VPETPVISIVDDDESVRDALRSLLRSVGFRVEVFACADDVLNSGRLHHTACLLLDARMPGMSGFELQRQLVADRCPIPLIFITAHGDDEMRGQALRATRR